MKLQEFKVYALVPNDLNIEQASNLVFTCSGKKGKNIRVIAGSPGASMVLTKHNLKELETDTFEVISLLEEQNT